MVIMLQKWLNQPFIIEKLLVIKGNKLIKLFQYNSRENHIGLFSRFI